MNRWSHLPIRPLPCRRSCSVSENGSSPRSGFFRPSWSKRSGRITVSPESSDAGECERARLLLRLLSSSRSRRDRRLRSGAASAECLRRLRVARSERFVSRLSSASVLSGSWSSERSCRRSSPGLFPSLRPSPLPLCCSLAVSREFVVVGVMGASCSDGLRLNWTDLRLLSSWSGDGVGFTASSATASR